MTSAANSGKRGARSGASQRQSSHKRRPAWDNPQFVDIVIDYYRMRHGGSLSRRAYAEAQEKLDAKPRPKISVPALFIHGSADACDLPAGAEGQEAAFTGGYERLLIPGVGHFPHRENASAVAEALLKQLRTS